jgi:hypothetical protein
MIGIDRRGLLIGILCGGAVIAAGSVLVANCGRIRSVGDQHQWCSGG